MNRREFLGLLAVGSVDVKVRSRMSKALDELEASVKQIYGPNIQIDVFENESRRMPLLIHAVSA
ncbi:hypothetical protein [Agrobacterium vitis]|uniref:hypothetical protein n=1 Tax=Agrobacterium vitis TaxID=373 RepID=UPI0015DB8C7B|nr:hypothetical protein [Agrobacterium vitis]